MTPSPLPLDRLRDPNPYDVLELGITASTAEISKAFTAAMKRRAYPVDVIARSRKRLLDPDDRQLASYLRIDFLVDGPDSVAPEPITAMACPAHLDGLSDLLTADESGTMGFDGLLGNQIFTL